MKRYFLLLILTNSFVILAQNRAELWTKLHLTKNINSHWAFATDFQYRSQANYRNTQENASIFYKDLAYAARLWVFYKLPNSWTIHVSPIAYFSNTDIINEDGQISHNQEVRSTFGITKGFSYHFFKNKNRLMYEARLIDFTHTNALFQQRLRLQNTASFPIFSIQKKHQISLFAFNEFFIKHQKNQLSFDQNRMTAALQYQYKNIELLSGYQHTLQNGNTGIFQRKIWWNTLNIHLK